MKRHKAWWILLGLLLLAWGPFLAEDILHTLRGAHYYADSEVGLMFGFWLFVWWPCHIIAALIVVYKSVRWIVSRLRVSKP
jgi:uncharacterized membrane protein